MADLHADMSLANPNTGSRSIPFFRTTHSDAAIEAVVTALKANSSAGGGNETEACHALLREALPGTVPFLTTSCTDALELAALAIDIEPGDEIIMPSWTFTSTANAFALRGAVPVFVDVERDTLNVCVAQAAAAITKRTRAIVCVHYAGVACDMSGLLALCASAGLFLIEDAAQAYGASWRGQPLGAIGDFGTFSFHGTKNVSCGEGGALIVRRADLVTRAELGWEKGTNRLSYSRGEVAAYNWCELGSSFLPSEFTASLLGAELVQAGANKERRVARWNHYKALFVDRKVDGEVVLPHIPEECDHNGHIFAIRLRSSRQRDAMQRALAAELIDARSHYQPLHLSPAGRRFGRTHGSLAVTEEAARCILRLPLYNTITAADQERVVSVIARATRADRSSGEIAIARVPQPKPKLMSSDAVDHSKRKKLSRRLKANKLAYDL